MFPPIQTFPEKGLLFFGKYFPGKKKFLETLMEKKLMFYQISVM